MTSIKFRALTHNDHKLFFEALGEHGKDFQNIQQYMISKNGKSTGSNKATLQDQTKSQDPQEKRDQDKKEEDKKREQIRNFYNKLYTKLSQLIGKLDDRIEKVNQELYLLINYGEIWKKLGFKFNNKTKKLLEELVHQGYTSLRFKNKNVRLRTPPCKALKKINEIGIDEKVKVVTSRELPKEVVVEFHPSTVRDWLKIQSMSQNPLVRGKLSIQKRLANILKFLETKWNVSQHKLNRKVDSWLKVPHSNFPVEDTAHNQYYSTNNNNNSNATSSSNNNLRGDIPGNGSEASAHQLNSSNDIHLRLRLKPSAQHELKEVNITRVVPDNHLDLSLSAYVKRLGESISKNSETTSNKNNSSIKDSSNNTLNPTISVTDEGGLTVSDNPDLPQGGIASYSHIPFSLSTPDSSILLERSSTSDQPSIAQARKHLNILQSLAGSFEGCENSRTCDDTQDKSILTQPSMIVNSKHNFQTRPVSFIESTGAAVNLSHTITLNNNIPALLDEDAAIVANMTDMDSQNETLGNLLESVNLIQHTSDSQNSRSVDFNIPKNLTIGDFFKMSAHTSGDDANDSFPVDSEAKLETDNTLDMSKEIISDCCKGKAETTEILSKPQNHMIEMKKLAEGWTLQDDSSMTIGELYLAFKCPEKIVLEYEFENFTFNNQVTTENAVNTKEKVDQSLTKTTTMIPEDPSNQSLIFKLLTTASLSLAQIERQKEEHKVSEQNGPKIKRRKGPSNPNTLKFLKRDELPGSINLSKTSTNAQQLESYLNSSNQQSFNNNYISTTADKHPNQNQAMTLHEIEARNQCVEEALKLLQPTRLSVFRRAR